MNLKNILIQPERDGFRLLDPKNEIEQGRLLRIRFETAAGWEAREIEFERDRPTLLHPFRKSMFIYTGEPTRRVIVEGYDPDQPPPRVVRRAREDFEYDPFFAPRNFTSYPHYQDPAWQDDYLPAYFGVDFSPAPAAETEPEPEPQAAPHPAAEDAPPAVEAEAEDAPPQDPDTAPGEDSPPEAPLDDPAMESAAPGDSSAEPNAY